MFELETTKITKGTKMKPDLLFKDESYQIMGACFEVYKELGPGFLEAVYQECLAIEFTERGIPFQEQPTLKLQYKKCFLKQFYEPDFICFGEVIIEIKAMRILVDEHRAQTIHYLKATGKKLGLLVNFCHYPQLEYERLINLPLS